MKNISINIVLWIVIMFGLQDCSQPYITKKYEKNPTKYLFNENINVVFKKISRNYEIMDHIFFDFADRRTHGFLYTLIYFGSDTIPYFRELSQIKIPWGLDNKYDFYLRLDGEKKSHLYFMEDGTPCNYVVDFHIHLTEKDSNSTMVEVFAINPRIRTGQSFFPSIEQRFIRPYIYDEVPSSTIEEYEILLKIGEILGVKDRMPECKYPKI